ncbi:MAG: hypothetical protein WAQ98_01810 [Blastocatellia bacterium]
MYFKKLSLLVFASLLLFSSFLPLPSIQANKSSVNLIKAQIEGINPQAVGEQLLLIDDGSGDGRYGGTGDPGFGWFNSLKPDGYPATLKEVRIAFSDGSRGVLAGSPLRIAVYTDPEGNGPDANQSPAVLFPVTCNNPGNFESYLLPDLITINSGNFIVGVIDTIFIADLPAFGDTVGLVKPIGSQSYVTLDAGRTFLRVDEVFPNFQLQPVAWLIRGVADVEGLSPIITRALYKKGKLKVFGRNFSDNAIIRINGERINLPIKFAPVKGRLMLEGTPEQLNLRESGRSNRLIIVVDGVASEVFDFTS